VAGALGFVKLFLTPHACQPQVKDTLEPPYQIAAQNSWVKGVGAYTGEIAPELLVDLGVGCGFRQKGFRTCWSWLWTCGLTCACQAAA